MLSPTLDLTAAAFLDSLRPDALPARQPDADLAQGRVDDWVAAFVARLTWLGAREDARQLSALGLAMHGHYDLLDPYVIARAVWRRGSLSEGVAAPA